MAPTKLRPMSSGFTKPAGPFTKVIANSHSHAATVTASQPIGGDAFAQPQELIQWITVRSKPHQTYNGKGKHRYATSYLVPKVGRFPR
jgi:hypothetical protein|uniref:Uncharacterized protein n=1 Tax=Picea glauca TaxID=3330 RepID=A0A101LUK2_PICGL|nr:hypothetical protein ABT39_MTgene2451 [Picea glauca]QHR88520.1 hypothetical protein Q903MT_gene2534 [Picea sitchensis]